MKYPLPYNVYNDYLEIISRLEEIKKMEEYKNFMEPRRNQSLSSYREQYGENAGKIAETLAFMYMKISEHRKYLSNSRYCRITFDHIIEEDKNFCLHLIFNKNLKRGFCLELKGKERWLKYSLNREIAMVCDDFLMCEYLDYHYITTTEDVITKYDEISISSILGFYLSSKRDEMYYTDLKMQPFDFRSLKMEYGIFPMVSNQEEALKFIFSS